jgi:hypothetical protein
MAIKKMPAIQPHIDHCNMTSLVISVRVVIIIGLTAGRDNMYPRTDPTGMHLFYDSNFSIQEKNRQN